MKKPANCPLCGRPNQCAVADGESRCWCFDLRVPPELLARVPLEQRGLVCVCLECVLAFNQSVARPESQP